MLLQGPRRAGAHKPRQDQGGLRLKFTNVCNVANHELPAVMQCHTSMNEKQTGYQGAVCADN